MIRRVLILCVGNICRSPTAEFLLRHRLRGSDLVVESAGLAALAGRPIDPLAESILAERGISARTHVARQVTPALIEGADLVLAMEKRHMAALHAIAPHARGRSFLLGRWIRDTEIPDPYGQSRETFERTCVLIERALEGWQARL